MIILPRPKRRDMDTMCCLALSLFITLLGTSLSDAADSLPNFPAPAGFINGAALSDEIRKSGEAAQPPSAKLIGMYYPTNSLADILNQGYSAPTPFCKAVLKKEYSTISDAKKAFATLVKNAKKESAVNFDPNNPAIRKIFKHCEEAASKIKPGVSIKIEGMSILGIILDKDTAHGFCMIINFKWSDGQIQADMPFALAAAFLRLGRQQVELAALHPFCDATSVTTANQTLLEWVSEIQKRHEVKER